MGSEEGAGAHFPGGARCPAEFWVGQECLCRTACPEHVPALAGPAAPSDLSHRFTFTPLMGSLVASDAAVGWRWGRQLCVSVLSAACGGATPGRPVRALPGARTPPRTPAQHPGPTQGPARPALPLPGSPVLPAPRPDSHVSGGRPWSPHTCCLRPAPSLSAYPKRVSPLFICLNPTCPPRTHLKCHFKCQVAE